MNIFITCDLGSSIWKKSAIQASIFMYKSIEKAGFNVFLLNRFKSDVQKNLGYKFYDIEDIYLEKFPKIDCIIMSSFEISKPEYLKIKESNPDCKFVLYDHYYSAAIDQEDFVNSRQMRPRTWFADEVWVPEHHAASLEYAKTYHNMDCESKAIPYLWSPMFISIKKNEKNINFQAESEKKNIVVLENNQNSFKNSLVPMLICERANHISPESFDSFSMFNTHRLKKNKNIFKFTKQLNIDKIKKLFLSGSWSSFDIYNNIGKYVLSYQENNILNYLFLEALYLNLPLIHNSEYIKSYGYYYNDCNINFAANQLINAVKNHEDNINVYAEQNKAMLKSFDPSNPKNVVFFQNNLGKHNKS